MARRLTWCEVSLAALRHNLSQFRKLVSSRARLAPVVKANAYGHGMLLAARVLENAGADALCVADVWEAESLRAEGVGIPIVVVGYTPPDAAMDALRADVEVTVYDERTLFALDRAGRELGKRAKVFVKLETGTNRQGVPLSEAVRLAKLADSLEGTEFFGLSSHFADIEDTTDHSYARKQLKTFEQAVSEFERQGLRPKVRTMANSAATILWPETHMDMVRVGVATYGMWPSKETLATAAISGRHKIELRPVLRWKTIIAQVKELEAGEFIGYGRTYRTTHRTRLAVLPVGYYDGYDRKLSNLAYELVKGSRAQVRGRVCMNMIMVDVTDVPNVRPGDEVVLLGGDSGDQVSADDLATWAGTINYEITTRISETIVRIPVEEEK